ADCHAQAGEIALARTEFAVAAELAAQRKQAAPEALAREPVAELAAKLAPGTLALPPPSGIGGIGRDGHPVDPRAWSEVAFLAQGTHTIVTSGKGKIARTLTLTLSAGAHAVALDVLKDEPPPAPPPQPVPAPAPARARARAPEEPPPTGGRTA